MSISAKEIIKKLSKENDEKVLGEVLDFYEYLIQKKDKEMQDRWLKIKETEPDYDEIKIIEAYNNEKENLTSIQDLIKELNLNED